MVTNARPSIHKISKRANIYKDLAGCYAFWWIGDKTILESTTLYKYVYASKGRKIKINYPFDKQSELPICLYIGKSTNIKKRLSQHILPKIKKVKLHSYTKENCIPKKHTTACQLRYGIDGLFRNGEENFEIINKNVGFSYEKIDDVSERFYKENEYIALYRPWFNIDSER